MSQVQVTLTFSSIALAIAAMSKIGADALVAGGDVTVVTHAGHERQGKVDLGRQELCSACRSGFQCNEAGSCLHPGGSISRPCDGNFGINWFGSGR
jgi:Na+-transporting NADH:ubiquinone oxidoreductase subunit NqrF